MNYPNYGTATYVTATGPVCITSANAQIIGILFQASATQAVTIYANTTATTPISGVVRGYSTTGSATTQPAVYVPFPANCSGGITISSSVSGDPKLTLFWNPTGGA